ncbi:MAG: hypothetical protein IKO11_02555, partial [Lachnospiraceae bacterium]|nr:hypothetical protein [Lachnospiraceae bacterium]
MKSSTRICRVLGAAAAVAVSCFTLRGHAGGTTASYEVLEEASAGAAEVVEAGIEPTEEEIRQKIEENAANAWKEAGSLVMANVMQSVNVREEPSENSALLGLLYKDCGGYILETWDDATGTWSAPVSSDSRSYTFTYPSAKVRLTWQWTAGDGLVTYDLDDYVWDGLVWFYDGIRNVGRNRPHDTTSLDWKNLGSSGAYNDL